MKCGDYVVDKAVPDGGHIRVSLEKQHAFFHDIDNFTAPDAVVGLNAGIGSYQEWAPTMVRLVATRIPFCFSEYTAHSLRMVRDISIPSFLRIFNAASGPRNPKEPEAPLNLELELNPFHGIVGQDQAAVLIPKLSNGYFLTWRPE